MCGIAGIINFSIKKVLREQEIKTLMSIKHRGPDDQGLWRNTDGNITLFHSRLAIQDLSSNGSQPMILGEGRYVIVYNGEIYNFNTLKKDYLPDVQFKSQSDTEVLLQLYIKYDFKFLELLEGMFSLAIYDQKKKKFFFARDQFGVKPLYYHTTNNHFIFSSEIKTFFKLNLEKQFNLRAISSYLTSEYYENRKNTFFKSIFKLEPGTFMEVVNGKIKISNYFHFIDYSKRISIPKNFQERKKKLTHLVSKSVRDGMVSDVPISIASSGGLDSSILQYEACKINKKATLISWDFNEKKFSEKKNVQQISKITKAKPIFYNITPKEIIYNLKKVILINEEPFAGIPIISYYLALKNINKNKVILDGSGIDEAHGGYDKYYINNNDYQHFSQDGSLSIKDIINDKFFKNNQNYESEIEHLNNLKNKMYNDLFFIKLPRALRFRDKISMNLGVELRPVFLNKPLIAYLHKLKKVDHHNKSYSKFLLRDAYKNKISQQIAFRKKINIQTPQSVWFKKDMKNWLESLIKKSHIWDLNIIDKQKFLKIYGLFKENKINNTFFIWQFINLHYFMNKDDDIF